ncbi:hypothetical protein AV521_45875 [Streptomyces sp. IMTB 2501]|nr:hypothetical protein AV521_45875 [Streptomyces sp. IMTB 2501]
MFHLDDHEVVRRGSADLLDAITTEAPGHVLKQIVRRCVPCGRRTRQYPASQCPLPCRRSREHTRKPCPPTVQPHLSA